MHRERQLEILCADAILKVVSARYAPGTQDRVLQFLADRGGVPILVDRYHAGGDLDRLCLEYWNAMLEPDALRLEDLVSALMISFATSFAASVLIEGGKANFPFLYRQIVPRSDVESSLKRLAALEQRRRKHLDTIMRLLDRKAEAIRNAQADLEKDLSAIRGGLLEGRSIDALVDALSPPRRKIDLTPIESVVRGSLMTEEQREIGFKVSSTMRSDVTLQGLPLSTHFGAGQIVQSRIDAVNSADYYRGRAYEDVECLIADLKAPLRNPVANFRLKSSLLRPPKKILPVGDADLKALLDQPRKFEDCRPMIGALVVKYGGMTCHTAVLSRGLSIPCIQLNDNFLELKDYEFGAIKNGVALLFQTIPDEFHSFI